MISWSSQHYALDDHGEKVLTVMPYLAILGSVSLNKEYTFNLLGLGSAHAVVIPGGFLGLLTLICYEREQPVVSGSFQLSASRQQSEMTLKLHTLKISFPLYYSHIVACSVEFDGRT